MNIKVHVEWEVFPRSVNDHVTVFRLSAIKLLYVYVSKNQSGPVQWYEIFA